MPTTMQRFHDPLRIATQPCLCAAGARSTGNDHLPPNAVAYCLHAPQWCLPPAEPIGLAGHPWVPQLFADRVLDHWRAVQGILRLGHPYGSVRLEAACRCALSTPS